MRKLFAFIFLLLMGVQTVCAAQRLSHPDQIVWTAEEEKETYKESNPEKESKYVSSFAFHHIASLFSNVLPIEIHGLYFLQNPSLDRPTPPPDFTC